MSEKKNLGLRTANGIRFTTKITALTRDLANVTITLCSKAKTHMVWTNFPINYNNHLLV